MDTVLDIDRYHVDYISSGLEISRLFKPAKYSTYGAARKAMKNVVDTTGFENLSLIEQQAVGRWNLITDQTTLDNLFSSSEQDEILKFHNKHKTTLQTSRDIRTGQYVYTKIDRIIYQGNIYNVILKVDVDTFVTQSGTAYSVRLYDRTHNKKIAEKTGLTNTDESLIDLGEILYQPNESSVLEVQIKKDGGSGEIDYECLSIEVI